MPTATQLATKKISPARPSKQEVGIPEPTPNDALDALAIPPLSKIDAVYGSHEPIALLVKLYPAVRDGTWQQRALWANTAHFTLPIEKPNLDSLEMLARKTLDLLPNPERCAKILPMSSCEYSVVSASLRFLFDIRRHGKLVTETADPTKLDQLIELAARCGTMTTLRGHDLAVARAKELGEPEPAPPAVGVRTPKVFRSAINPKIRSPKAAGEARSNERPASTPPVSRDLSASVPASIASAPVKVTRPAPVKVTRPAPVPVTPQAVAKKPAREVIEKKASVDKESSKVTSPVAAKILPPPPAKAKITAPIAPALPTAAAPQPSPVPTPADKRHAPASIPVHRPPSPTPPPLSGRSSNSRPEKQSILSTYTPPPTVAPTPSTSLADCRRLLSPENRREEISRGLRALRHLKDHAIELFPLVQRLVEVLPMDDELNSAFFLLYPLTKQSNKAPTGSATA